MKPPDIQFEEVYDSNRDDLYSYIVRHIREENTALDILQDVFLNFFKIHRDRKMPEKTICRMYLFKVARNLLINHVDRAYTRRVELVSEYEGNEKSITASHSRNPEDEIIRNMEMSEAEICLRGLLGELKEEQRTVLLLRFTLDMRLESIAQIMNMSVSKVSRLIHQSSRQLKDMGKKKGLGKDFY